MKRTDIPFLRNVEYVASFPSVNDCPADDLPVVAVTGRSNSGKSSLISALCDTRNLARTSQNPGKTRSLNYFRVPSQYERGEFYLVDLPGFGFAKLSQKERQHLRKIVDEFLIRINWNVLILVLDARRDIGSEEEGIIDFCNQSGQQLILARSKWDLLNQSQRSKHTKAWEKSGLAEITIPISSTKAMGLSEVLRRIRNSI